MSLSEKAKLEQILNNWISFETAVVTWNSILQVLSEQGRKDIVREVINYLERPAIYSKYIKKDNFEPSFV